jgi:hypothetical protein
MEWRGDRIGQGFPEGLVAGCGTTDFILFAEVPYRDDGGHKIRLKALGEL